MFLFVHCEVQQIQSAEHLLILIAMALTMCSLSLSLLSPSLLRLDVPDRKMTSDEEEAKRIAEMGKPVLGEHSKLEVIIEESYEFKVWKVHLQTERPDIFHHYKWSWCFPCGENR